MALSCATKDSLCQAIDWAQPIAADRLLFAAIFKTVDESFLAVSCGSQRQELEANSHGLDEADTGWTSIQVVPYLGLRSILFIDIISTGRDRINMNSVVVTAERVRACVCHRDSVLLNFAPVCNTVRKAFVGTPALLYAKMLTAALLYRREGNLGRSPRSFQVVCARNAIKERT